MEPTVVGVDIAKRVFQLHWIDTGTGEVFDRQARASAMSLKITCAMYAVDDTVVWGQQQSPARWRYPTPEHVYVRHFRLLTADN